MELDLLLRYCEYSKYVMFENLTIWSFLQTFQNKKLAHAVKESTLDSLITELLLWLLDERVPHMDDGSQLLKALNVLMLKILVKSYYNIVQVYYVF